MSSASKFATKNFRDRVLYGAILTVVLVIMALLGGYWWFSLVAAFCLIGQWEFYRIFQIEKAPIGIIGYCTAAGYLAALAFGKTEFLFPIVLAGLSLTMAGYVFCFEKLDATKAMAAFFGFVYAVVFLSFIYQIRIEEDGLILLIYVLIASFGTDIMAYFSGILFGKHKMTPVLSPKKTVEGAIGGVLGATLIGAVYSIFAASYFSSVSHPIFLGIVLTAITSFVSMIGDLTASAFKRNQGVKDYSHLIPGHGGILDRFDSVIMVAPIFYYVFQLLK